MKKFVMGLFALMLLFATSCSNDDDGDNDTNLPEPMGEMATFTVTIENVVAPKPIFQSGVFNTPVGANVPAPIFPGEAYEFMIDAGPNVLPNDGGTRLSFVAMFVQSNDLFFAPGDEGIALYNDQGNPIGSTGPEDVTDQVFIWDAGTEVNEPTGGPNQKPQQAPDAEDQGIDENGNVTLVEDNVDVLGNNIPDTDEVITVTIENVDDAKFLVRILNVSTETTIATPAQGIGTTAAVPVSPGVFAVHTTPSPFFVEDMPASNAGSVGSDSGLEDIAEDGFPSALFEDTKFDTGLIIPLSPGAYAVHVQGTMPLYQINTPDYGQGLEGVAEDGMPGPLAAFLSDRDGVSSSDLFDTPSGASNAGAIGPGGSYQFTFDAFENENLSLATMFVQSNDWFYAFNQNGLPLFKNGNPISGDVTNEIFLYDAGTEFNEYPGAGLFQVIRQPGPDTGDADSESNVREVAPSEENNIPITASTIRVTISVE